MTDPLYFGHFRRLACDPENRIAATPPIITPSRSAAEPRRGVIRTQKLATGFADGARRANHRSACPALFAKIFRFTFHPNHLYIFSCPALTRGVSRSSRTRAGCGGRKERVDEGAYSCGRRSRVVLTPRRWRQVGESDFTGDGGNKARSPGRGGRDPLKPLRREGRVFRGTCGD